MHCNDCPFKMYECVDIPEPASKEVDIIIVGEAPGQQEVAKNKFFIGPSGDLLKSSLKRVGGEGLKYYITNALHCRPPQGSGTDKKAIVACNPRLLREVSTVKHKAIIALGNAAIRSLTGSFEHKVTQLRGANLRLNKTDTVIFPVIHPAAVLRSGSLLTQFEQGLQECVDYIKNERPKKDPGVTNYAVARSLDMAKAMAAKLLNQAPGTVVAADIETGGLRFLDDSIRAASLCYNKNAVWIIPYEFIYTFKEVFESSKFRFVWHNGKFDIKFLKSFGVNARVDEDTMLMHYALNETRGTHGLEQLSTIFLGAAQYDISGKYLDPEFGYSKTPESILYPYMAKDSDYTLQLFNYFNQTLEKNKGPKFAYQKIMIPASGFLTKVEAVGIKVDKNYLDRLSVEVGQERSDLAQQIETIASLYWDPDLYKRETGAKTADAVFLISSPKQLLWLLQRITGRYISSTNEATLVEMESDDETGFIRLILKWREVTKQLSTYISGMRDHIQSDGRIHSTYLIHGTETGRLSSRQPNLQNIPRNSKLRKMFVPREGYTFIEVDYSQAELRVLAALSGDPWLKQVYVDGKDLHHEVAVSMFGVDYDNEDRVRAKAINFGIAYGLTGYSLERDFNLKPGEGQKMVDGWYARMPRAAEYLRKKRQSVYTGKLLTTPLGRQRRFGLVTGENINAIQNQATNFEIQSVASDMTLLSGVELFDKLYEGCSAYIVNIVHDSMLIECPDDFAIISSAIAEIKEVMESVPNKWLSIDVPFKVDFKIGKSWGELEKIKVAIEQAA